MSFAHLASRTLSPHGCCAWSIHDTNILIPRQSKPNSSSSPEYRLIAVHQQPTAPEGRPALLQSLARIHHRRCGGLPLLRASVSAHRARCSCFIVHLDPRSDAPQSLELSGKVEMLLWALTFLTSTWYIKNPFLKSKIVEVCDRFPFVGE